MTILSILLLIIITILFISVSSTQNNKRIGFVGKNIINIVSPFQKIVTRFIKTCKTIWNNYFNLVSISKKYEQLKNRIDSFEELNNECIEIEYANQRLRSLLDFTERVKFKYIPAEVIGRDPSYWSKTMMIDKGKLDGVTKGFAVVTDKGIVGQIIHVTHHYSKVMLVIDQNSSVDALIRRSRARGIIKGSIEGDFRFQYVLRKDDVNTGDIVISSGLDGVFPKGLCLGTVSQILKTTSGIFQEITVIPFVDYDKLEEVLILCKPHHPAIKK